MAKTDKRDGIYLGVDVGGTKIQGSLVAETGTILARQRRASPREGGSEAVLVAIEQTIVDLLDEAGLAAEAVAAIGLGIPGVVDPDQGLIVVTPNMNLSGVEIVPRITSKFDVLVVMGNDCNLGTLGETWLGSAQRAESTLGIFVGTGIGGGFVQAGKLWRGWRESALEIGHMIMEIGGPRCGCGNRGCFEALAGRSAIERDIREAIKEGKSSILSDLLANDLTIIRSGALRKALAAEDKVVMDIMQRASEVLGYACVTLRHVLDPHVIVLGGGVIEACHGFMLPIVEKIVASDRLAAARDRGGVVLSALGDDAVVLGAVALAREHVGRSPFDERSAAMPAYPTIGGADFGKITVGGEIYTGDIYIRVTGKVKRRKKSLAKEVYGSSHMIGPKELETVCKGDPNVLFIGSGHSGQVSLTDEGADYLRRRAIECHVLATGQLAEAYNACRKRKAALVHVTC